MFSLFVGAVSWMSKRQSVVVLSTTEAEYITATHAIREAVLVAEIVFKYGVGTTSYNDRL